MRNNLPVKKNPGTTHILFVHEGYSSFVRADAEILGKRYNLAVYFLKPDKRFFHFLFNHLKFIFFFLKNRKHTDLVYSWFCDYHAVTAGFLAKLFHKKHIVVVAGFDGVSIPSISFGLFYKNDIRARLALKTYRRADHILTVDPSLIKGENHYVEGKNIIGIANFDPGLVQKATAIPFGYDARYWKCAGTTKKQQVLSVGLAPNNTVAIRKGFDLFMACARQMPQYRFIYIGLDKKNVSFDFAGIPNLTVIEKVPQEQLKKYFCESKVFAQFSISEGLPNTLCEAMLCECVATGSNVNGIPRVIRNKEYILEKKDVTKATEILERALNAEEETGKKNREYIEKNYPPEARANALYQIIDSIYKTTNE